MSSSETNGCRDLESFKTWIQDGKAVIDSQEYQWDIAWTRKSGHRWHRWYIVLKQGDRISVGYPVATVAPFSPFGPGKITDMIDRKNPGDRKKIKDAIKSAKYKPRTDSKSKVEWSQAKPVEKEVLDCMTLLPDKGSEASYSEVSAQTPTWAGSEPASDNNSLMSLSDESLEGKPNKHCQAAFKRRRLAAARRVTDCYLHVRQETDSQFTQDQYNILGEGSLRLCLTERDSVDSNSCTSNRAVTSSETLWNPSLLHSETTSCDDSDFYNQARSALEKFFSQEN